MAKITLNSSQQSLVALCLSVAAERFTGHAQSVALSEISKAFRMQAEEALQLSSMFGGADSIEISGDV